MLPGVPSPLGRLDLTEDPPSANARASGGIFVEPTGEICAAFEDSTLFCNGLAVTALGQLCVADTDPIEGYVGGLPVNAAGTLVIRLNVVPPPNTPFVGGVAVGEDGVYATDAFTPVTAGFSHGFSGGFDAG